MPHKVAYATKIVAPWFPFDDKTSITGPYVPWDGWQHCTVIIIPDDQTTNFDISFDQATDTAGTGTKTLPFTDIIHTATDGETFTEAAVTSNSYTTGASGASKIYIVEFDSADMDVQNGFDHIKVDLANCENTAIYACVMIFSDGRYQGFDAYQKPVSTFTPTT